MDKNGTLTISNFQAGIADSPLSGFSKMSNVDIYEKPGVIKMQYGAALSFSTTGLPIAMVYDSLGNQYVACSNGVMYKNGSIVSAVTGLTTISDIKVVSDGTLDSSGVPIEYIFITSGENQFGFYGPTFSLSAGGYFTTTSNLNNSYKQIVIGIDLDSNNKPIIYFGNGKNIAAITNFTYVSPTVTPTFSTNYAALTLQPGHFAYSLNQVGKFLAIGTVSPNSNTYGVISQKIAALILWDRTSPSFNLPIFFKENGVTALLQMENRLYCAIGNRARIYLTDGTNYKQIKRIPFVYNREFGNYAFIYPNAMTLHNGDILVGLSGSGVNATYGIYAMSLTPVAIGNTEIQYPTIMRNSPSTGSTGDSQTLNIGFIYSTGADQLYFGWQDGSTYGVDVLTPNKTDNYITKIESAYYNIGDRLSQHTFKRMEIALSSPLIAGQYIRISYRTDPADDYTVIGTYTSTDFGTENSFNTMANLAKIIDLQILIEMKQSSSVATTKNIELISVTFTSSEKK